MAKVKLTCICFLLFVLFFSQEIFCIEGRRLKLGEKVKCTKCLTAKRNHSVREMTERGKDTSNVDHAVATMEGYVESFRPTTPGHSPGIGHSIRN
uniref:Uncharacterized protein n=1 Tax=Nelumbo nucifera TaxID=4432 RepID=A0A822XL57_NELNU|nr:TPA_asm: hypothetical protein HUJ06_023807 [Nelumbo nucifera]